MRINMDLIGSKKYIEPTEEKVASTTTASSCGAPLCSSHEAGWNRALRVFKKSEVELDQEGSVQLNCMDMYAESDGVVQEL